MRAVRGLPGPPPAPVVGNALQLRRDRLGFLTACARDHGDAARFRLGPVEVVLLSHPDAVREVLAVRQHDFRKGPVLQRARAVLGDGLLTSEGEVHRRDRRLLQAAFHPRRVARYARQMVEVAAAAVGAWAPGEAVDVHAETVRTTLTVAGRTLFGTDVADDVTLVHDALGDVLSAYDLLFLPFGERLLRLPVPAARRLRRGTAALDGLTARLIAERRGSGADPDGDDLLSVLLAEVEDERHVRDQVVTLLLAGHETTANALAFACHLLAAHPEVQEAVAAEAAAVCGDEGVPAPGDADRLPLARAVLAETLRLYPPSWAMGRETATDTVVAGVALPAGTTVVMSQWVVHRDPRWWPEPDRFDPGRFDPGRFDPGRFGSATRATHEADATQAQEAGRPRFAYFPFGGGTRQCIGEGFAWTEGVLTLATILAHWRLRPVAGREPRLDPLLTLRPRDGVWLVPSTRPRR